MGLRFRKSISLCKGVRLNFGKTSASVTFGQRGFHKTISTSGRVTTSIGFPGTGINYTDTRQLGQPRGQRTNRETENASTRSARSRCTESQTTISQNTSQQRPVAKEPYHEPVEFERNILEHSIPETKPYSESSESVNSPGRNEALATKRTPSSIKWNEDRYAELQQVDYQPSDEAEDFFLDPLVSIDGGAGNLLPADKPQDSSTIYMSKLMLPEIYSRCDPEILWEDILLGNSAEDLNMDTETWMYCRKAARQVVEGDIDTYLQVIADLAPVNDLLLYGSDFEFGTDRSDVMETEFVIYPDELLKDGKWDPLLGDYVSAVALRVARDLFSLLPVQKIAIHVVCESKDIFSGIFDRKTLNETNYDADISTIMKNVKYKFCSQFDGPEIIRMQA